MSVDYMPADWIPSPYRWTGRSGYQAKWIILHGTAGGSTAQAIAAWFQNPQAQVSSHFIIGQDGYVVQCVALADSAWANGVVTTGHDPWWSSSLNPNFVTVSIEHCKPDPQNATPLTAAQEAASFTLIRFLCDTLGIPARQADANGGITGHFSIDPVNRSQCPGVYPWSDLWAFLASGEKSMGWTRVSGGANDGLGHHVGQGFADTIFTNSWQASDGLCSEEYWRPTNSFVALSNGHVLDWDGTSVHVDRGAWVLADVWSTLTTQTNSLKSQLSDAQRAQAQAQTSLTSAQAQVSQLQQQIAQLQSQSSSSSSTTDPLAAEAKATLAQLKATLAKL